jgi:hypothetical protein
MNILENWKMNKSKAVEEILGTYNEDLYPHGHQGSHIPNIRRLVERKFGFKVSQQTVNRTLEKLNLHHLRGHQDHPYDGPKQLRPTVHRNWKGVPVGYLIPLHPIEQRSKEGWVIWECVCTFEGCGKHVFLNNCRLAAHTGHPSGGTISCGCFRKKHFRELRWKADIMKSLDIREDML